MSLPIEDIVAALRDGNYITDPKVLQAVAKDLVAIEKEVKAAKEPSGAKTKTRLVALVRGDAALKAAVAGGAFVVSVPDGDDSTTETYHGDGLLDRLRKATIAHNEVRPKRGKGRSKIETWHQLFTQIKAKTLKESGSQIGVKQKGSPVECVVLEEETVLKL